MTSTCKCPWTFDSLENHSHPCPCEEPVADGMLYESEAEDQPQIVTKKPSSKTKKGMKRPAAASSPLAATQVPADLEGADAVADGGADTVVDSGGDTVDESAWKASCLQRIHIFKFALGL